MAHGVVSKSRFRLKVSLWGDFLGVEYYFSIFYPQKAHPCLRPRRLNHSV